MNGAPTTCETNNWTSLTRRDWLAAAVLAGATFAVFARAVGCEFINLDDPEYVTSNTSVTRGLSPEGVRWAFTSFHTFYWHPLTWLSLQLDATLWGSDARGFHLTNVLLHSANAALLFLALRTLTGAFWRSAAAAALFAVHPLRVESVAWVAERKDVLSMFFGLLALWCYARYAAEPSVRRYVPVLLALVLGLLSKPMLVSVPFVLLVLDWWPLRRWSTRGVRALVLEKLPLFGAAVAVAVVVALLGQARDRALVALQVFPPVMRLENAAVSYVAYLWMAVWPVNLAVFYPHPVYVYDGEGGLRFWQVAGAALLLTAFTAGAVAWRRRAPYLLTGWLWFLGTLLPVIGLAQAGAQARADRFTYFPMVGIAVAVCWGAAAVARSRPRTLLGVTAVVLAALVARTEVQLATWQNSLTVWEHASNAVRKSPEELVHYGDALLNAGRDDDAARQLNEALRLDPTSAFAHSSLGDICLRKGQLETAERHLRAACRFAADSAAQHMKLGKILFRQQKLEEAAAQHQKAVDLAPQSADAYRNLGQVELAQTHMTRAAECYREVLRLRPDDKEARAYLGYVRFRQGQTVEGIGHLREAVRMDPRFGTGHLLLGLVLESTGDQDGAGQQFLEAVQCSPELAQMVKNRHHLAGFGKSRPDSLP